MKMMINRVKPLFEWAWCPKEASKLKFFARIYAHNNCSITH